MVDWLEVFTYLLFIVIGIPTALLVLGRVIGFFTCFGATKTVTLKPEGAPRGKVLVVYEPGAVGLTQRAAEEIGREFLGRGFEVNVSGIRSPEAKDTAGYDYLVLGTPTYIGRPTYVFKNYIKKLHQASGQVVGIFLTGPKGAQMVGLVPKVFLKAMQKPLEESGVTYREMAFAGYAPFGWPMFVSMLVEPAEPAPAAAPEIPAQ